MISWSSSSGFAGVSHSHRVHSPVTSSSRSSTAVRSGVSLLSVFFMLGITLFGQQSAKNSADTALEVKTASGSFFDTPLHMLQIPVQYTASHDNRNTHNVEQQPPAHALLHMAEFYFHNHKISTNHSLQYLLPSNNCSTADYKRKQHSI